MRTDQIETGVALDVPFRGNRDYVHSTDLFEALENHSRALSPGSYLKNLILRHPARRQVRAQFTPQRDAFGTFELALPHRVLPGWLMEDRSPIMRRVAFDEAAIAREAIVEPGRAFLSAPVNGYSGFEQMIVLLKMLCAQIHPGPWLFASVALDRSLTGQTSIEVRRSQTVLGRMIDARLHQGGRETGRAQMVLSARKADA
jgi:hypothetical protein